jgi:tetratricopeptide (TPR) repeat protein
MVNIATVLSKAGRIEQAQAAYAEALPRFIKAYGPEHPDTAFSLYAYGVFRSRQHEYAAAERLLRQALAIQVSKLPDGHPSTADTWLALGEVLTESRQFAEAERLLLRAREVMKKTYGAEAAETRDVSAALDKLHSGMRKTTAGR